jgi:hypothetical protein
MSNDAIDLLHQTSGPVATRIVDVSLQSGMPTFERGSVGGPTGRSKYQPIFDQVKELKPGNGWVKVPTTPETADKDLAHLRTALKRQGGFPTESVKVRMLDAAKTLIAVFIPKDAPAL